MKEQPPIIEKINAFKKAVDTNSKDATIARKDLLDFLRRKEDDKS